MDKYYKSAKNLNNNLQKNVEELKKEIKDFLINVKDERHIYLSSYGEKWKIELILTEEEVFNFSKQITTHTIENGKTATSGAVIEPLTINIRAIVGELFFLQSDNIKYLDILQDNLNEFSNISPSLSNTAQEYFNKINNIVEKTEQALNRIDNSLEYLDSFFNGKQYGEQKKVFILLNNLFKNRYPIYINTFYGIFNNMAISKMSFRNENLTETRIDLTLQQMDFVYSIIKNKENSAIADTQKSEVKNNGIDKSVLKKITENF